MGSNFYCFGYCASLRGDDSILTARAAACCATLSHTRASVPDFAFAPISAFTDCAYTSLIAIAFARNAADDRT